MREYVVIYENAGTNYSAYVPDLPGCVACGGTIEETEALMKEAIGIFLEETRKLGLPVPEPTTRARSLVVAG